MNITLNGKPRNVKEGATIGNLLSELEMNPAMVNVQLNGAILARDDYSSTSLKEGDEVEILMFMGGGQI